MKEKSTINIQQILDQGVEKILTNFPENASETEKKIATRAVSFIRNQINTIIEDKNDFDWFELTKLNQKIVTKLIDSRVKGPDKKYKDIPPIPYEESYKNLDKKEKYINRISYEGVYTKNNITWLLDNIENFRKEITKNLIKEELDRILTNLENSNKDLSLLNIKKQNNQFYHVLKYVLRIKDENDNRAWEILYRLGLLDKKYARHFSFEVKEEQELYKSTLDKITNEGLEDIFIKYGGSSGKLSYVLRLRFPELADDEINRITRISFSGLGNEANNIWEDILAFEENLDQPIIKKTEKIALNQYEIVVEVPQGIDNLYIKGPWSRKIPVIPGEEKINFRIREGENEISLVGINEQSGLRSVPTNFILQGEDDPKRLESLLEIVTAKENINEEIENNEYIAQLLSNLIEVDILKKYTKKFEEGDKSMEQDIEKYKESPAITNILKNLKEKFRFVNAQNLENFVDDENLELFFYQKYVIYRIKEMKKQNKEGGILALEPGLGKTACALFAINGDESFIACPNSIVTTWIEEANKFMKNPNIKALHQMSRKQKINEISDSKENILVTNFQLLQGLNGEEHKESLDIINAKRFPNKKKSLIIDEAHSMKNEDTNQSKVVKQLKSDFILLITASPFKDLESFRKMMHLVNPLDNKYSNSRAFKEAFPQNDPETFRTIQLLKKDVVIRLLKEDVMEYYDMTIPLEEQSHCLPHKEYIDTNEYGSYEMTNKQAESISCLMEDYTKWEYTYGKFFPKHSFDQTDRAKLFNGNHLSKSHALRQTVNNCKYTGESEEILSPKQQEMIRIVDHEINDNNSKVVLFCLYNDQAKAYAKLLEKKGLKPALFIGETADKGYKRNESGEIIKYKKIVKGGRKQWAFDNNGYPIEDKNNKDVNSEPMQEIDFERLTFQKSNDRKVIIVNYQSGAIGTTFTRAGAMIFDDMPRDYILQYQSEDRIHRIDNDYKKYNVRFYSLISKYPEDFLERAKRTPTIYITNKGEEVVTNLYDRYFRQGTYDQVHHRDLKRQRDNFELINNDIQNEGYLTKFNSNSANFFGNNDQLSNDEL